MERGGGDRTAGARHPARREAAARSVLMLARVNLSWLVSGCAVGLREGLLSDIGPTV